MSTDRRQARILAMQALCQWDVQQEGSPNILREFFEAQEASESVARYAGKLVRTFWDDRQPIDDFIAKASRRWSLDRISPVERNIIRAALVEVRSGKVPVKAAINEAIEIAKEYGGQDSPRFVNGMLDEIVKGWQAFTEAED